MRRRHDYLIMAAAVGMSVVLTGCSALSSLTGEEEEQEVVFQELNVKIEKPNTGSIINYSDFMGTVSINDTVSIIPKVSGEITETFFEEGDYVNEGDIMLTIDDTQARQGLATAQAAYQSTKSSVDRMLGSTLDAQTIQTTNAYKSSLIGLDTAQYSLAETCDNIGDLGRSIDDINSAIGDLDSRMGTLQQQYVAAQQAGDVALMEELSKQMTSVSQAKAAQESAKSQLQAQKNQLEGTVHVSENQVKSAQLGVDMATLNEQELVTKVLSETLSTASTTLNQAQVAVNNASQALDFYKVKSPVSGIVEIKNADQYGMAQAGAPSYVIKTDETMKVTFFISESNINNIAVGDVISADYAGNTYLARISDISNSVDQQTGLFMVEATFVDSQEGLHSGSSVKLHVMTEHKDNTMTVPVDSVYYEGDRAYVFIDDAGYARKCYITTGLYDQERIEVTEGITADNDIITSWSSRLKDGEKVNGIN